MKIKGLIKRISSASQSRSVVRDDAAATEIVRDGMTIEMFRDEATTEQVRQIEQTNCSRGAQIANALKALHRELPQSDKYWQDKIEFERNRLLSRSEEPLIDGSLGKGLPRDAGKTVRDACEASKAGKRALLLYLLIRELKPVNVIELGTNVGISSAYIAAALKLNGQGGTCVSLDASVYRQKVAKEVHQNIGIDNVSYVEGLFADTLHSCLLERGTVDLAFIDGHHQYQPTLDYFDEIFKFSTPNAVFVFDDIRWSDGMEKAWSRIQSDDRLGLIVDHTSIGICVRHQEPFQRFLSEPIRAL